MCLIVAVFFFQLYACFPYIRMYLYTYAHYKHRQTKTERNGTEDNVT